MFSQCILLEICTYCHERGITVFKTRSENRKQPRTCLTMVWREGEVIVDARAEVSQDFLIIPLAHWLLVLDSGHDITAVFEGACACCAFIDIAGVVGEEALLVRDDRVDDIVE
jgi:hypothetical protein